MTDVNPVGAVAGAAQMGPALTGLRPSIEKFLQLLGGRLEVQNGVALETQENSISLTARLVGNSIQIEFLDPKPNLDIQYLLDIKRLINGLQIFENKLIVNLSGFPDPTLPIES